MKTYRILDLDNCISDDSWRIPKINWKKTGNARYEDYHLLCGFDRFVNFRLIHSGHTNIILTGRPVLVRGITEEWLARAGVPYAVLLMRNNDCELRSAEVKREMLRWLPAFYDITLSQIVDAHDDHQEIVDMYVSNGIRAIKTAAHAVSAYINPFKLEDAR